MKLFTMKSIIVVFCFVFAVRIYAEDSGPFQLFSGTIWRNEQPRPVVLKINTQTGQTWQLLDLPTKLEGFEGLVYTTGWTPLTEDVLNSVQKLQGARAGTPTRKPERP
jgi:hypothetical protein